jgi:hypothetical protein
MAMDHDFADLERRTIIVSFDIDCIAQRVGDFVFNIEGQKFLTLFVIGVGDNYRIKIMGRKILIAPP